MINNFRILTYIRAFTGYSMSIGLGRSSTGGDPVQDNVLWVQTREGDLPLCCECPDLDEMLVWACPKEEVKQSKRPTNQPVKLLDAAPKLESGLGGKWIRI